MSLIDLQSQVKSQLITYDNIIKNLSQEFNIGEIYLQKLCRDINIKTSYSYAMALSVIYTDLSNELDSPCTLDFQFLLANVISFLNSDIFIFTNSFKISLSII